MLGPGRLAIASVALLVSLGLAGSLLLRHHGRASAADALCAVGEASGCDAVNQSPWAKLGGVSLAAVGMAFAASLTILLALASAAPEARDALARLALALLGLALVGDVVLAGVQAFLIGAWCELCLATYGANVVAFAALWPARRAALAPLGAGAGRVAVTGWLLGTLAAGAGALGADRALASAASGTGLLGTSAGGAELEQARAEIERLQQTLDDPRKLEAYFEQKSLSEFENATPLTFDLSHAPPKGPADAPVKVVEFSDFLCPHCRNLAFAFGGFLPQSQNRVSIHFKHYPLDQACNDNVQSTLHRGACELAKGAVCAADQDKFWPYHDRVFQTEFRSPPTPAGLGELAAAAGLDRAAFASCLTAPATLARVKADIAEGAQAGVSATPSVFINGRRAPRLNEFVQMVDKELARLGLPPLPSAPPQQRAR